MGCKIQLRV